jgi:tetratricopeptide (TPR) repeat protein
LALSLVCAAADDGAREHNDRGLFAIATDGLRMLPGNRNRSGAGCGVPRRGSESRPGAFQARKYSSAIDALRRAASRTSRPNCCSRSDLTARTHQNAEAQRVFEEFLRVQPDTAQWHVFWGDAYASQNQVDKATQEFRRALELDPKLRRLISAWASRAG